MSATLTATNPTPSGSILLFSIQMADDNKALAQGLKRRDPDILDQLIEQYQYRGKYKFEAWLFRIARNLVIDWQRQKKMQSLDALTDPEEGAPMEFAEQNQPSPLRQVLSAEEKTGVHASLDRIPAVYREVLLLRFQEDLGLEEIAGVLAAPLSTVKSRLYRGLEALRGAMPARPAGGQGGAA